ncbi:MAG: rhomboid family intramembrane serine protease [Gemmataceae bacterium]
MRQIATLPDEPLAPRLADHLLTLQIHTQLIPEGEQVGVWVRDEDKLPQARQEVEAFLKAPDDARYGKASAVARSIRQEEAATEKEYQRRQRRFADEMESSGAPPVKGVTLALTVTSVLVTLASNFGAGTSSVTQALSIAPYRAVTLADGEKGIRWNGLAAVEKGEAWRLVTPIFLHFDILHLGFNMVALLALGLRVERARGALRYAALALALAVASNVAEYYVSWSPGRGPLLALAPDPSFGGMSGVLYGLFGYMWMKSRFQPELGLAVTPNLVLMMTGWFVLCAAGVVPNVANVAHGAGLLGGVVIGLIPRAWRRS